MSDQSILYSSNSSNLSALERELNRSTINDDAKNLKDEIYHALIEDQKEQILFLKEEILFLRKECIAKSKYIAHLQDNTDFMKKNEAKNEVICNLPNEDVMNEDANHKYNPFNPFNQTLQTWVSSEIQEESTQTSENNSNNENQAIRVVKNRYIHVTQRKSKSKNFREAAINAQLTKIRQNQHKIFLNHKKNQDEPNEPEKKRVNEILEQSIDKKKRYPQNTILITGDSLLNNIEERRMSKKYNVKVRAFPGADIRDMYDFMEPLIKKRPKYVIIHIGSNDSVNRTHDDIINRIEALKAHVLAKLPDSKVFMSCPIVRTDNGIAAQTLNQVRSYMRTCMKDTIDNVSIDRQCLGKAGLHLNAKGSGRLAMNFISLIRSL